MKKFFMKYSFILIVLLLICLAVYLIYNKPSNNEIKNEIQEQNYHEEYSKEITIGISDYDNINPLITNNKEIINIDKLIFEPLIELDENYKIKLCLAKECAKISSSSYVIKINNEIKWNDGENLKAEDVEFTIKKLQEGKSVYSENVKQISSIQIIDNSTMRLDLNEENPYFEYNLIFPIIKKNNYTGENLYSTNKIPIGTGMYKIVNITDKKIILEINNNWRKIENKPKIEKINLILFNDMGELYNSFKIGNIDVVHTSSINYEEYIGTIGYKVKEYKGREYDFLALNCKNEMLKNKEIRKAISFAIDKANIIQEEYKNKYYISDSPIDYGSYLYEKDNVSLGYNPEQTKKILQDAGFVNKNSKWQKKLDSGVNRNLSFNLIVQSSNEKRVKIAEIIKEQLKQIDIEIIVKKVSDQQYKEYLKNKNYDIIFTGINNGFSIDIEYFYGENNIANYNNDEVKSISNEIKNIDDEELFKEKYNKIFEIVQDEMPYIGLYRNKNSMILNQKVSGEINPNNYSLFYNFETWCKK